MALVTAEARFYNGSILNLADKQTGAGLSTQVTLSCEPFRVIRLANQNIRSNASSSSEVGFAKLGGVANPRAVSTLRCRFPTYVRIDWDKIYVPEGKNVTIKLEEGFVFEGFFPGSTREPLPANNNLLTFRTPKRITQNLPAVFNIESIPLRIKQLSGDLESQAGLIVFPIYNPGKLAALFGGVFTTVPNVTYIANGRSDMFSRFGPVSPAGTPVFDFNFRLRFADSNMFSESEFILPEYDILQVAAADFESVTNLSAEAFQFIGIIGNLLTQSNLINNSVKTASGSANLLSEFTKTSTILRIKQTSSNVTSSSSLSANVTNIQRVPRWRFENQFTITTQQNLGIIPVSANNDFVVTNSGSGVTTFRRYTFGNLSTDSLGIVATQRRRFDVGNNALLVATDPSAGSGVVVWKTFGGGSNPPLNIAANAVAACKTSGSRFSIYNNSTARYQFYDTSGTLLTGFDSIALNTSTPSFYTFQFIGSNVLLAAFESAGLRIRRWVSGSGWTVQTFSSINGNEIYLSSDGLTVVVTNASLNECYRFTRSNVSSDFSLTQTITDQFSRGYFSPSGDTIFLGDRTYIKQGNNFVYVRNVGFPEGLGQFTFGDTAFISNSSTQIRGTTAFNYIWQ